MTSERWQRIEELFQSARRRESAGERAAFLESACGNDTELRAEVEALLSAEDSAGSFINTSAMKVAAPIVAVDRAEQMAGRAIGHYKVLSLLGAGGMGEVYLAEDTRIGRKVALKLLPEYLTRDLERVRRFQQEARAVVTLNHPNIVTVYEIDEADGVQFIASELVKGETLRARLSAGPMKINEAVEIAIQVADALSEAHHEGVIHRDIKPENIMIRPDGYVKVLDFGIAKLIEQHVSSTSTDAPTLVKVETNPGMVLGTAYYMSPEQTRGLPVDERTDIWSLGVVLYSMLTGQMPFAGDTPADVVAAIIEREPRPVEQSGRPVPQALNLIVLTALAKNREQRYRRAADMLAALRQVKSIITNPSNHYDSFATASSANGFASRSALGRFAPRTIKRAWFYIALGFVLLVAVGYYVWSRRTPANAPPAQIKSIAVLPFKPLIAANRDEVLEMGMADTLITRLGSLHETVVRPLSAVRRYTDPQQDPLAAGRALDVDSVLDGSVARVGDRVRVTARLLRVADGKQLWDSTFDQSFTDIFTVQDRVSERVAGILASQLNANEQVLLTKRYTQNTEAYRLYLEGRYFCNRLTADDVKTAIQHFRQATDSDPHYALAYSGLADCYNMMGYWNLAPPREVFPKAKEAAINALQIDEALAEAHTSLAYAELEYDWDPARAESGYRRAIELNPNYVTAHQWYGEYLCLMGRLREAKEQMERARQIDPLSVSVRLSIAGWVFETERDYDRVINELRQLIQIDPGVSASYGLLGACYKEKGMNDQAVEAWLKLHALEGWPAGTIEKLRTAYQKSGMAGYLRQEVAAQQEESKKHYVSPIYIAMDFAMLGEKDRAFEWLDKAYEDRSGWLLELKFDPEWDNLRGDPRFAALTARVGFPNT
jgi:serine/threonine protein kinase/TolB-like protein/Tfp pilus assembly protein PilF